jgi:hypothetical protein
LRCLFDFFDYPTSFLFGSITGHHLAEDYTPSQKECRAGGSEHRRRAVLGVPLKPSNGSTHSESFGEWGYTLYWQNNFRTGEIEDATELYNTFCREKSQKLKAVIQNKARPFIHAGLSFILGGSPSRTLRDHWPSYCKVPDDFFASSLFSSFENEILELDKNFFPPDLLNDDFLLPELVEKLYDVTERASHPEEAGNAREAEEAGNAGETAAPSSSEILALSMPNALEQGYSEQDRATSLPFTPLALTHTLQSEAAQNSLEAIERVFIFLDLDGAAQSPSELTEEILQEAPPAPKSPIIDDHVISAILAAKDHVESERLRRKKTWSFRIKSLLSLFRF